MATFRSGFVGVAMTGVVLLLSAGGSHAEIGDLAADLAIGQSSSSDAVALPIGPTGFGRPQGIAIDRSVIPNRIYVSDTIYHRVLGWSDVDALVDGAPADIVLGQPDFASWGCNRHPYDFGITPTPTLDSLCQPSGLAVDASGNLYVADARNCRVLVFNDPFGTDQVGDLVLGQGGACSGLAASAETMYLPQGVAVDPAGNVFVADTLNCRVLEFDGPLASTDATADRVFGQTSFTARQCSSLYFPVGLDVDPAGTLHVGSPSVVSSFTAALASDTLVDHTLGTSQCNDAGESASTTCGPRAVASDPAGRLYLLDSGNSRVLRFDSPLTVPQAARVYGQPGFGGNVTLFEDACNTGGASASSLCLRVTIPLTLGGTYEEAGAVAVDTAGRLYVADGLNNRVVRYDTPLTDSVADLVLGQVDLAGTRLPTVPITAGNVAVFDSQNAALAVDQATSRILIYTSLGSYPTTPIAVLGQPDLVTTGCNTGGLGAGSLCGPTAALVDASGNLWIADTGNNRVLEYAAPWFTYDYANKVYVVAATATRVYGQVDFTSNDCGSGPAGLCQPRGVAVDGRQNLYIADSDNHRVVHHENPLADGIAERVYGQATFAGTTCNASGLDADALCDPRGLVVDGDGNLYVADRGNNRVVRYEDVYTNGGGADRVFGQPSVVTSTCGAGPTGLCQPSGVALDRPGNLLIADTGNSRVLVFESPSGDAVADRVLGQPDFSSTACDPASAESLCEPIGVIPTRSGDALFVADAGHQRLLRYDAPYCLGNFVIGPLDRRQKGISQPQGTKLKIAPSKDPAVPGDTLTFSDRLILLEADGGISGFDTPLLTLSTAAGIVYRERVPSVSNTHLASTGGTYEALYLEGERDSGIDQYKISTHFVIPGDDAKPQFDKIGYKGRAVGLDLSDFAATQATFRAHFPRGSLCFTSALACKSGSHGSTCRVAR